MMTFSQKKLMMEVDNEPHPQSLGLDIQDPFEVSSEVELGEELDDGVPDKGEQLVAEVMAASLP